MNDPKQADIKKLFTQLVGVQQGMMQLECPFFGVMFDPDNNPVVVTADHTVQDILFAVQAIAHASNTSMNPPSPLLQSVYEVVSGLVENTGLTLTAVESATGLHVRTFGTRPDKSVLWDIFMSILKGWPNIDPKRLEQLNILGRDILLNEESTVQ